jgi:hypothetical protein
MNFNQYVAVFPVIGVDLHLKRFNCGFSWLRHWDDLQELNGKVIDKKIKIVVPDEDVREKPSKFYLCSLTQASSEEEAYQKTVEVLEEFIFLSNVYLSRSFRPLLHEAVVVPFPKTVSVDSIILQFEKERVKIIQSPYERWVNEVPYFGAIRPTSKSIDFYPAHFEITDLRSNIADKALPLGKKKWFDFEQKFPSIYAAKNAKSVLIVIGQLYASANSTEIITLSYMMLWEILEAYAGIDKGRELLLSDLILNQVGELFEQEGYTKEVTRKVSDKLRELKKETLTEQMARLIQNRLFPELTLEIVYEQIKQVRETRNSLTHPLSSKKVDKQVIINDYLRLRDIVDRLITYLQKGEQNNAIGEKSDADTEFTHEPLSRTKTPKR